MPKRKLPSGWAEIPGGNDGPPPIDPDDPGPQDADPARGTAERVSIQYQASSPGACYRETMDVIRNLGLYQKAGLLVQALPQQSGRVAPVALSEAGLACLLSDHIRYVGRRRTKEGDYEEYAVAPPKTVVAAIHRACHWPGVPYLRAITSHPIVRRDGSVRSAPGYDPETEVLSMHSEDLEVEPLDQDGARHAREMLLEIVDEFPFVGIGADVWLAAVLTPLVRPWCGPSPMIAITSSTPSSGKGRLADLATIISCGGEGVEGGALPPNDEEWQKRLISWALMSPEVIYFDNVVSGSRIGSAVLDMALTRDRFSGRILGQSRMVEVELMALWLAAGNNLGTFGDTARRVLMCRIEPRCERPELRNFVIPDILGYARENRSRLLKHALGILSGWVATTPEGPSPPLGSFEEWSRVVRGAIIWAGGEDVADALASQTAGADDEAQLHRALLEAWIRDIRTPSTAAQVIARCDEVDDLEDDKLPEVIAEMCPGKGNNRFGTANRLSAKLRAIEGRVRDVEGVPFALERCDGKGPAKWNVEEV